MRFGLRELVIFVAVLSLPLLSYMAIFKGQNAKIEEKKAELAHDKDMLRLLREETSRNDDLKEANLEIASRVEEIEARLPLGKEVDRIVRRVSQVAVEAGLEPPSFKSTTPIAAASYFEQPLEMSTSGDFNGFYDFLTRLERLPRITRIVDMSLERDSGDDRISVEFTLSIYFREEGDNT